MDKQTAIQSGNAQLDGIKGWFVGSMYDESFGLRHSDQVELKWSTHKAGEERKEWVTSEFRTTVAVLISGKFKTRFRNQSEILSKPGDFVIWGIGHDHNYHCLEDSVLLTIRWPSLS